jgi:hypothetical protein
MPRSLPSNDEAVERATNLFLAFQEYGRIAPARLGMSWHVTPEPDGKGGYGTKVEIVGQWMGTEAEYDVVLEEFEKIIRRRGVGELQKERRTFSESRRNHVIKKNGILTSAAYLQSMHQIGNWTALDKRGPTNIGEHVDFYAKVRKAKSRILYSRRPR